MNYFIELEYDDANKGVPSDVYLWTILKNLNMK